MKAGADERIFPGGPDTFFSGPPLRRGREGGQFLCNPTASFLRLKSLRNLLKQIHPTAHCL